MNKQALYMACTLISLIASFTLCKQNRTHIQQPAQQPAKQAANNQPKTNELVVRAKRLTYDETYDLFGDRVKKIFYAKNPLAPIQISVINKSDKTCLLADANINLKLEQIKNIKSRLHYLSSASMAGIFFAGAIPLALCGAGLAFGCYIIAEYFSYSAGSMFGIGLGASMCAASLGLFIATPITLIRKTADHKNAALDAYVEKTVLGKAIAIPSGASVDILVFAKEKNVKEEFSLALVSQESQEEKIFVIQLA